MAGPGLGSGGHEKWWDSGYILKVKQTGFFERSVMGGRHVGGCSLGGGRSAQG